MSGYTKGPWHVIKNDAYETSWLIVGPDGNKLAQVANWQDESFNIDAEANAKLMASATELYEAMEWIVNHEIDILGCSYDMRRISRDALNVYFGRNCETCENQNRGDGAFCSGCKNDSLASWHSDDLELKTARAALAKEDKHGETDGHDGIA